MTSDQNTESDSSRRLSIPVMAAYGAGEIVQAVVTIAIYSLLLFYYQQIVGLSGTLTGLALGIAPVVVLRSVPRQGFRTGMSNSQQSITANGQNIATGLPVSLHDFLKAQGMLPRSVVVELNGEAVPPSEFVERQLNAGDSMEIVKVTAGG